ncbi:MAG: hypothetical protein NZ930_03195 [Candidatus Bipolaricaulota bacterium]|nr:hypothetical protein [Candidatus Bipolaricaulota bacterium]MDW8030711.1 hypothetical protein [Candidatus Bipolaricaulota bacterium]
MRGFFTRFSGELQATLILHARYWLEAVATWMGFLIVFVALFFGIQLITGGVGFSEWGQEAAIRYAIWVLCLTAVVGLPEKIQEEAMTGVLEQRFLAPKGGISSLIMSHIAGLLFWSLGTTLVFFAMVFVTRTSVYFDWGVLPVVLLILLGIEGVGYFLAGLALLFKRIGAVTQLLQTALLGLALLPVDRLPSVWQVVVQMLPLAAGTPLLNDLLLRRINFDTAVNRSDFWLLIIDSMAYLVIGLASFRWAARRARQHGLPVSLERLTVLFEQRLKADRPAIPTELGLIIADL